MGSLNTNVKIGSMDRRITFREATETQSSTGATSSTWADVATVFASVNVSTNSLGSERMAMEKETTFNRKFFVIRYRTDITEKMILIYESKEYDIKSIQEIDGTRKRFLKIQGEKRE